MERWSPTEEDCQLPIEIIADCQLLIADWCVGKSEWLSSDKGYVEALERQIGNWQSRM
jgi:hypothetical protein